jgi:hypothetical protein
VVMSRQGGTLQYMSGTLCMAEASVLIALQMGQL